jgi:hypothetical protein
VNTNNTNKGFFQNTGAVAGTFTVVGLVGVAMLIFIITAVMRRRRAERFDKEIALAAAEAAATAHNPGFDDEYGYGSAHAGTGGYGGYADTYQAPVQFPSTREAYGMANVSANAYPDPDNYSVGAGRGPGAAGIGAGALYRSKSGKDQPDPFNAYAIPQDPAIQQANLRYRNPGQDHWGDQTLAGGGYDVARGMPHPNPGGVVRNKSTQSSHPAHSLSSHYSTEPLTQDPTVQPPPVPDSYLDRYRAGSDSEKHQFQTRPLSEVSMTDAYGGITTGREPPALEQPGDVRGISNPFERYSPGDRISGVSDYSEGVAPVFAHDDSRMSLRDDEDYGAGRRVLKVCSSSAPTPSKLWLITSLSRWQTSKSISPWSCGPRRPLSSSTSCPPSLLLLLPPTLSRPLACLSYKRVDVSRWP